MLASALECLKQNMRPTPRGKIRCREVGNKENLQDEPEDLCHYLSDERLGFSKRKREWVRPVCELTRWSLTTQPDLQRGCAG